VEFGKKHVLLVACMLKFYLYEQHCDGQQSGVNSSLNQW